MSNLKRGAEVTVRRNNGTTYQARVVECYENRGPWVRVTQEPKGTKNPATNNIRPARIVS